MKKLLLSAIFVCAVIFANAQACNVGYSATGIYDDYSSTTEPGSASGAGLYFYAGAGTSGPPDCSAFSATASRTTNAGKLSVVLNGPYGCYVPFGLSFGMGAPGGKKWTLDLTGNSTFTVDVTNPSSDTSTIAFRIGISDSLGNSIDTYASAGPSGAGGGDCNNAWAHTIVTILAPGATTTFSGTFAGGYQANYGPAGSRNPASGTTGTACALENDIDMAHISNINFTVTSTHQNINDNYNPYPIGNGANPLVIMDNLRVGACVVTGLSSPSVANNNMSITPNPASGEVLVSYSAASGDLTFNVTDVTGKVLKSVAGNGSSANISVADLAKGMYFVTTISNNTPVSVSKLVVE